MPISLVPIGLAVSCQDTCLCSRYKLIIVFVFSFVCFHLVCIFICGYLCCRHGFISTSGVYAARMCGLDISVGTKGVSQNHLLSFDDNKVLKLSIGNAKHLFKCTGSKSKYYS